MMSEKEGKRARTEIVSELDECERALKKLKKEEERLRNELNDHPETITELLLLWGVPEAVRKELCNERGLYHLTTAFDPRSDTVSCGAGTMVAEREEWECVSGLSVAAGGSRHFSAHRWTGLAWECTDFAEIGEDEGRGTFESDEDWWWHSMVVNEHDTASALASLAFHHFQNS